MTERHAKKHVFLYAEVVAIKALTCYNDYSNERRVSTSLFCLMIPEKTKKNLKKRGISVCFKTIRLMQLENNSTFVL
jgi:hypothetical protein